MQSCNDLNHDLNCKDQPLVLADTSKILKNPKVYAQKSVQTSKSEDFPPPLSAKCLHWTNPPDYGQPKPNLLLYLYYA